LLFDVGTLRLFQGERQEAIRLFRRTLELDPRNLLAMNNLAMLLAAQPQGNAEALACIDRAIAIAGSDPELLDSKAWILICQGDALKAEALLRDVLSSRSSDARHHFHLAVACQLQGRLDEAREALHKALELELPVNLLMPEEFSRLQSLEQTLH
jgi:Flp pilus assembly protein TadD